MSHEIQQGQSTKVEESPAVKLPESSNAYQAISEGPLLQPPLAGWDWLLYIISFQWLTAIFTSATPINTSRNANVEQLFEHAGQLLVGRIHPEQGKMIKDWLLNQASPEWLAGFAQFLNEAERLEALKPGEFPLSGAQQTEKLQELYVAILPGAANNTPITDMLKEIIFLTTTSNTQPIEATLKPLGDRSRPYLHSAYASKALFTLLFEIRTDQKMLLITDPRTKETRTIQFNPDQNHDEHHLQLAKAIYDLSHPVVTGGSSTTDKIHQAIKAGSIYKVYLGNHPILSLSNRTIDLSSTAFIDRTPILDAKKLIESGMQGDIEIPILSFNKEKITFTPELTEGFCNVTFEYQSKTYQTHYPLEEGATLPQLATRITNDHTLERDLLLIRSFFARKPL